MSPWASGVFLLVLASLGGVGCSSDGKRPSGSARARDGKIENRAAAAVAATTEDERLAPVIQREVNALFFGGKKERPGGLGAFSAERLLELDAEIAASSNPAIVYYRTHQEYFDRVEDSGGGFLVAANGRRLVPYVKTEAGRRKLFLMDSARVREMVANPCFAALEDCGEYASDGEENTALLEAWSKKYPEKEFRFERRKVVAGYLASLKTYAAKFERRRKAARKGSKAYLRATGAAELVGKHVRSVEGLLER